MPNTALNPYFVRPKLDVLAPTVARRRSLEALLALMTPPAYRANVAVIHESMFELLKPASANAALNRLLNEVNVAAKENGVPITAHITRDKQGGAKQRWVWFEGPIGAPPRPAASELDAIGEVRLVADQRGLPAGDLPVVVLLTFNEHETAAVLHQFHPQDAPLVETRSGITYNLLGVHGQMRIVHRVSRQGTSQAQLATEDAIKAWSPRAVVGVGIAFGVNPKQKLGDVLISRNVRDYELSRVGPGGETVPRGTTPDASHLLYQRLEHVDHVKRSGTAAEVRWPRLRFGTVLTGNKLVDDEGFRDRLVKLEPEAVGGDMEGLGLAAPCDRHGVDWIIVKAICDRADGNKNTATKDADQKFAAQNAAFVIHTALSLGPIYDPLTSPTPGGVAPTNQGSGDGFAAAPPPTARMNLRDLPTSAEVDIVDPQGRLASLDKEESADLLTVDREAGVDVMGHLHDWVSADAAAPVFVLLGEYGMGKTVTCQRLADQLERRRSEDASARVPLYFDLREVTNLDARVPTLNEILQDCMDRGWVQDGPGASFTVENVYEWIDHGAVVIFDGLDEVLVKLTAGNGQIFTRTLFNLLDNVRQRQRRTGAGRPPKVMVSCRTQYFRTLRDQRNHFTGQERGSRGPGAFQALLLLPFSEEQILCYLATALPGSDPTRLLETLRSVHNLEELAHRPYTLRLVAEFLPQIEQDRLDGMTVYGVTLYRRMAMRWLDRDYGKHHIQPEHKLSLAAHLAAHLWRTGRTALPASDLEDWFHEWIDTTPNLRRRYANMHPDHLEEDLRTATFLTRDDVGGESRFRFAHTSLQEFFLSEYLIAAIRDDAQDRWAMRRPSDETLDFLGQSLAEAADPALLGILGPWRRNPDPTANTLLLAYALIARKHGWLTPALQGIQLQGSVLNDWVIDGRSPLNTGTRDELDLSNADFTKADLRGAVLAGLTLTSATFDNSQLGRAEFHNCRARGSRWCEVESTATTWIDTDLTSADWHGIHGYRPRFLRCLDAPDQRLAPHTSGLVVAPESPGSDVGSPSDREGAELVWLTWETHRVNACAWSPDGTRLATASGDRTARVWDAATGQPTLTLTGHTDSVNACAWSPDGTRLATASGDRTARVWDTTTGQPTLTLTGHTDSVRASEWSPDGTRLATASDDRTIRLWDGEGGQPVRITGLVQPGPLGVGGFAVWEPAGSRVIQTAGEAWRCLAWQVHEPDGKPIYLPLDHFGVVPRLKAIDPRS